MMMQNHRLLKCICESFENICFLYSTKSFLDISKNLVDAELIYNLSSLYICDILHLLRSYWSNMALMQVSHPHVILFLFLIGFIYFCIYFLNDVSSLQIFSSTIRASEKPPSELGNIVSLCSSLTYIWSRCFCLFTRVPIILKTLSLLYWVLCYTRFIFNPVISFIDKLFRNDIFMMCLRKHWCTYCRNEWLQHDTFILSTMKSNIHFASWTRK